MPASSADATPGSDSDGVPMVQSSVAEYTRNDTAATATMPAASPSRPSMKLMALMVITTSRMVSVTLRSGSSGTPPPRGPALSGTLTILLVVRSGSSGNTPPLGVGSQGSAWPLQTRMPAAATWAASLLTAPRPHRSSTNPTTTTNPPASSSPAAVLDPAVWKGSCRKDSRPAISSPATRPPYMARPPSSGVGAVWVSLARGSCIVRVPTATRRTNGTSRYVTAAVTSKTRAYSAAWI